jgi:hypothetical protein
VAVGTPEARKALSPKTRLEAPVNQIHPYGSWNNTMLAMWKSTQLEVAP